MKYYLISEEQLMELRKVVRSLHASNIEMFSGRSETTRDFSFKIKEIIDSLNELESNLNQD
jgi:hypothetical protein